MVDGTSMLLVVIEVPWFDVFDQKITMETRGIRKCIP